MRKVLIISFLLFYLFARCTEDSNKKSFVKESISLENSEILNNWLSKSTGLDIKIFTIDNLQDISISLGNYEQTPSEKVSKKLNSLKEFFSVKPVIKKYSNLVEIDFNSNDTNEKLSLFFLENRFIITGYYGGNSGESLAFEFKNDSYYNLPYEFLGIDNQGNGIVSYSFYDPKGSKHPYYDGHIYIDGKLNFKNDSVYFNKNHLEEIITKQKHKILEDYNFKKNTLINATQVLIRKSPQNKKSIISDNQSKLNQLTNQYNNYLTEEETRYYSVFDKLESFNYPYSPLYNDYNDYDFEKNEFIPDVENKWKDFLADFKNEVKNKNYDRLRKYTISYKYFEGGGDSPNSFEEIFESDYYLKNLYRGRVINHKFQNSVFPSKIITLGKSPQYLDPIFEYIKGKWYFIGIVGD